MSFDLLVLTAAHEAQAAGYRAQLAWRRAVGLLAPETRTLVVADPGGRRVGSLGATLHVLALLAEEAGRVKSVADAFAGRRILICHSGGDSRRTPAYAAQGKVFTPVPTCDDHGTPLALFDLILRNVSALPAPAAGQVLITSGDVLLTFDASAVDLSRPGITGIAAFGPTERGSRHGVYVPASFCPNPQRAECVPVLDFLQKPTEAEAEARGAVDPFGHVAVDTGLLSLDPAGCARLLAAAGWSRKETGHGKSKTRHVTKGLLAEILAGHSPALDLYEELTMAVSPRYDEARYLTRLVTERGRDAAHSRRMRVFYRAVRPLAFHVNLVPYCDFFHIGSSRELLVGFSELSRTARTYRFENGCGAKIRGGVSERAFLFNTRIDCPLQTGRALLEAVHAPSTCPGLFLDGDNLVTGLPPDATVAIRLPPRTGLVCLPVGRSRWAAVVYGLEDDFKTPFGGAKPCLFLNTPMDTWMARTGLTPRRLWRGEREKRDGLWQARLWRIGALNDVLSEAVALAASGTAPQPAPVLTKAGTRFSLAELLPRVNHTRLLGGRQELRRQVCLLRITKYLLAHDTLPSAELCGWIRTADEARQTEKALSDLLSNEARDNPLLRARILRLLTLIRERWAGAEAAQESRARTFAAVAEAVAFHFKLPAAPRPAAILHDQVVWATTPVRIDFAGGWSDTPPICTEQGGTVLNAAVTLNGLYPIQVMAKLNTAGRIRLASIDLGERREFRSAAELLDHHDPTDWAALAKAALVLTGIAPPDARASLSRWLDTLGGGLDLTLFSALPKGSGMGTSSILGAAIIACLERVLGLPLQSDRLIRMTSILEQRLCTGGGWQDQVGGILPGVKLIRTQPGPDQTVSLRWTPFDMSEGSELRRRCLLYYTGQKRMARNILHNVVSGYLARDPALLRTVGEIKNLALEVKEALDAQDLDAFAHGLRRYWELKKRIDPGSTNPQIESILNRVARDTQAALLPGAGGGGFILLLANSAAAAARIRRTLEAAPPNGQARFFDFAVDTQGLKITVL